MNTVKYSLIMIEISTNGDWYMITASLDYVKMSTFSRKFIRDTEKWMYAYTYDEFITCVFIHKRVST